MRRRGLEQVDPAEGTIAKWAFTWTAKLRFKSVGEIDHKNLYQRAIVEIDAAGKQFGADQIPWVWTLNFKGPSSR